MPLSPLVSGQELAMCVNVCIAPQAHTVHCQWDHTPQWPSHVCKWFNPQQCPWDWGKSKRGSWIVGLPLKWGWPP